MVNINTREPPGDLSKQLTADFCNDNLSTIVGGFDLNINYFEFSYILKVEYKALMEDIKGLMAKGSLADIKVSISDNASDGLFYYHDKVIGGITYNEGISIRVVFDDGT